MDQMTRVKYHVFYETFKNSEIMWCSWPYRPKHAFDFDPWKFIPWWYESGFSENQLQEAFASYLDINGVNPDLYANYLWALENNKGRFKK